MRPTGIDHNVPYTAVAMIRDMTQPISAHTLPDGYFFAVFTPADEENWVQLQTEVTHVESREQGRSIFREEFLQAPEGIPCEACPGYLETVKRMVLVKDTAGNLVGAAALWMGDTFGEVWQRLHWVAVHPDHNGQGIGKCIISRALELYRELGCEGPVYLTSQTKSYRAVRLYGKTGFIPYMGEKPAHWPFRSDIPGESFQEENQAAWKLIYKKLTEHFSFAEHSGTEENILTFI